MIYFEQIKFTNLCSYGDASFEFNFEDAKVSAFIGINGAGKSTILDAMAFVLYGKPWRKVVKAKLVNSYNKRLLVVALTFRDANHKYKVVRGIKPDVFEVWRDGKLINQDAKSRDYQKVLEDDILGLSWQAFNQVVIVGKATYTPFMQLDTPNRRAFVESVLSLQVFSAMKKDLALRASAASKDLAVEDAKFCSFAPRLASINATIARLKATKNDTSVLSIVDAVSLHGRAVGHHAKAERELSEARAELAPLVVAERAIAAEVAGVNEIIRSASGDVRRMKESLQRLDTTGKCPVCGQAVDASDAKRHSDEITAQVIEIEAVIGEANAELEAIRSRHAAATNAMNAQNSVVTAALQATYQASSSVREAEAAHNAAKRRATDIEDLIDASRQELVAVEKARDDSSEIVTILTRANTVIKTSSKMLDDSGVKATILRKYIPVINSIVNKLLADLGFFAKFELDVEFNDKILSKGFEELTYNSYSEGEKLRIDMAVMLAWRELCIMTGSAQTNLLIFDEILDGSFDQQGLDALMVALTERDDLNLVVITHHPDRIDQFVDRHLIFEKVDGYSTARIEN